MKSYIYIYIYRYTLTEKMVVYIFEFDIKRYFIDTMTQKKRCRE